MSIPSVFRNAKSVSPAAVSSPVAGSRLPSPNWCVPVAFRPGRVEVLTDLVGRGLPAQLVDVLGRLEELESPRADRGEVVEHLRESAGQRHQRPEIGRVLRVAGTTQVAHRRRDAEPVARRDAESRRRVTHRELLHAEQAGRDRRSASAAVLAQRHARAAERSGHRDADTRTDELAPAQFPAHTSPTSPGDRPAESDPPCGAGSIALIPWIDPVPDASAASPSLVLLHAASKRNARIFRSETSKSPAILALERRTFCAVLPGISREDGGSPLGPRFIPRG